MSFTLPFSFFSVLDIARDFKARFKLINNKRLLSSAPSCGELAQSLNTFLERWGINRGRSTVSYHPYLSTLNRRDVEGLEQTNFAPFDFFGQPWKTAQYSLAWVKLSICVVKIEGDMDSLQIAINRKMPHEHTSFIRLFEFTNQLSIFPTCKLSGNGLISRQKGKA